MRKETKVKVKKKIPNLTTETWVQNYSMPHDTLKKEIENSGGFVIDVTRGSFDEIIVSENIKRKILLNVSKGLSDIAKVMSRPVLYYRAKKKKDNGI